MTKPTLEQALDELETLQDRERRGKPVNYARWDYLEEIVREGYEEEAKRYED